MEISPIRTPKNRITRPLAALIFVIGNSFFAWILISSVRLRETPIFWRRAGGYPEYLQEWVRVGFPLLYGLDLVLIFVATLILRRALRVNPRLARIGLLLAFFQWALLAIAAGLAVQNNLRNVGEGRPLHWHPGDPVE